MSTEAVGRPRPKGGGAVPFRALLWRLPWLRPLLLLTPPMAWFVLVYLASLVLLLITAFWSIDPFTTQVVLAFPLAYYMAKVASRRVQSLIFAAVLLPRWASYLARVYAWILILNHTGVLNWSLQSIGLPPANIGYTNTAMWLVFSYIWLPFMIIPTYAA